VLRHQYQRCDRSVAGGMSSRTALTSAVCVVRPRRLGSCNAARAEHDTHTATVRLAADRYARSESLTSSRRRMALAQRLTATRRGRALLGRCCQHHHSGSDVTWRRPSMMTATPLVVRQRFVAAGPRTARCRLGGALSTRQRGGCYGSSPHVIPRRGRYDLTCRERFVALLVGSSVRWDAARRHPDGSIGMRATCLRGDYAGHLQAWLWLRRQPRHGSVVAWTALNFACVTSASALRTRQLGEADRVSGCRLNGVLLAIKGTQQRALPEAAGSPEKAHSAWLGSWCSFSAVQVRRLDDAAFVRKPRSGTVRRNCLVRSCWAHSSITLIYV
jgi:hypothetical protein